MNFEEFLKPAEGEATVESTVTAEKAEVESVIEDEEESPEENIDVQKAVVASLAADKAIQDEEVARLRNEVARLGAEKATLAARVENLKNEMKALDVRLADERLKKIDEPPRNPNALALIDRAVELPDRFPGETRDHVLEVIKEARDKAEQEGRCRRAQILESVLVANEPNGSLAERRAKLTKIFSDNGNIVSGPVIEALTEMGLSHKNGEDYLLPSEIIARNY